MSRIIGLIRKAYTFHFVRYTTVGAVNTVVIFGLFLMFDNIIGTGPIWSNRIAYIGGLMSNFTLNKIFTFRSRSFRVLEVILFLVAWAVSYGVQSLAFRGFMNGLGWSEEAAAFPAYPLYGIVFFLLCRYMAFHPAVTRREEAVPPAAVLTEDQQNQVVEATAELLKEIGRSR